MAFQVLEQHISLLGLHSSVKGDGGSYSSVHACISLCAAAASPPELADNDYSRRRRGIAGRGTVDPVCGFLYT